MSALPTIPAPPADIRSVLQYDRRTGHFWWIDASGNRKRAGSFDRDGYVRIMFRRVPYRAHRLAWWFVTGEWADGLLDHRNRRKADNRFSNLRKATRAQNAMNADKRSGTSSAFRGVTWLRKQKKWQAQLKVGGRGRYLGIFDTELQAARAYEAAATAAFGEFARAT